MNERRDRAASADGVLTARIDADLIARVARTIAERFHPERIILFGSRARGEAGPDSDLDLCVEMETPLPPPERAVAVGAAFGLHPWPMDIVVYTPEEVAQLKDVVGTLLYTIEREGTVLYERR
ncbi:MAG TPA: nucleotidyltransferase domain-containing protein [Thermomicrobiales bacterium]|nr:nucleotidyltransferase domain-containing protein [Thermomicrobiales bacterium]